MFRALSLPQRDNKRHPHELGKFVMAVQGLVVPEWAHRCPKFRGNALIMANGRNVEECLFSWLNRYSVQSASFRLGMSLSNHNKSTISNVAWIAGWRDYARRLHKRIFDLPPFSQKRRGDGHLLPPEKLTHPAYAFHVLHTCRSWLAIQPCRCRCRCHLRFQTIAL